MSYGKDGRDNQIRLLRIRERGLVLYTDCECVSVDDPSSYDSIGNAIASVLKLLGINNAAVNLKEDMTEILSLYLLNEEKKSLLNINPELAKEWHHTKNGNLLPEHLAENSSRLVWWQCKNGHEWQASLHNRSKGKGCPYCSGRTAITGENDLRTLYPDIAKEWNKTKNAPLMPSDVKSGSSRKVWWRCSTCGYEWKTAVCNRTKNGTGCPKCGEIKKGPKRKTHEDFCKEMFAINKNIEIIGRYVLSTKKVQCKCRICGNTWEAFPSNLLKGKGCPVCSGRSVAVGVNDLITLFPNIAKEWHPSKNERLMPSDVKSGSNRKVWWICSTCGYEWKTAVCNRTKGGTGCPRCGEFKKGYRRKIHTEHAQLSIFDVINTDHEVKNIDEETVAGNANISKPNYR